MSGCVSQMISSSHTAALEMCRLQTPWPHSLDDNISDNCLCHLFCEELIGHVNRHVTADPWTFVAFHEFDFPCGPFFVTQYYKFAKKFSEVSADVLFLKPIESYEVVEAPI